METFKELIETNKKLNQKLNRLNNSDEQLMSDCDLASENEECLNLLDCKMQICVEAYQEGVDIVNELKKMMEMVEKN